MPRKKGKSISFDAMVKFFMQSYNIPTKKDFDKILARLDRLEILLEAAAKGCAAGKRPATGHKGKSARTGTLTATDMVLETIRLFENGARFSDIQERTGFPEKKLRNIIFRLKKLQKIAYKDRGLYIAL